MDKLKKVKCTIAFLFIFNTAFSQSGVMSIKEYATQQVLENVAVVFTNLSNGNKVVKVSDKYGKIANPVHSKSILSIRLQGYQYVTDTIMPGESKTYYLQEDYLMLNQVVITATKTPKTILNTPVLTQVITRKDIKEKAYNNVVDVLSNEFPSFEINEHPYGSNLSLQGLKPVNVLILIDGERLAGETRGNIDYSRLNTIDIERIEIVKGAGSALYGSQAMGAVINIITKKNKKKLFANAYLSYTNNVEKDFPDINKKDNNYIQKKHLDLNNLVQNYSIGFKRKKWAATTLLVLKSKDAVQLKGNKTEEAYFEILDTIIQRNVPMYPLQINGYKDYSITQKLQYDPIEKLKSSFKFTYYKHHNYDYLNDNKHELDKAFTLQAKISYTLPNDNTIETSLSNDVYQKYDFFEILNSDELNYRHQIFNPKFIYKSNLVKNQKLVAGVEYINEKLLSKQFNSLSELEEKQTNNTSIFGQNELNFNSNFNTVIGLRADYNNIYGFHLSPKLSFLYRQNSFTHRFNYARGFRSPNLKELYINWNIAGVLTLVGNDKLKPETNQYFSFSTQYAKRKINTNINIYYNHFKNKIEGIYNSDKTIYKYQNTTSSKLLGSDFSINFLILKSLTTKINYSYVNEIRSSGNRLSEPSPHTASMQLSYYFNKNQYKGRLYIDTKYIGSKTLTDSSEIVHNGETITATYKIKYPAYQVWNIGFFQSYKNLIDINLGVKNLFNYKPKVYTFNTLATVGRQYYINVNINLNNK